MKKSLDCICFIIVLGYGIAFKKHSPYVRQFSSIILKLRSNGFLELIKQKWFDGSCPAVAGLYTIFASQ